tara:strand:- start:132 stop:767 length:636 start_codon:yes stop_codon:yes gene_type:complete
MISDEKIEEIKKELMSLGPEDQQKKFQELVQDMNPEDQKEVIEKLTGKSADGSEGGCPFCSMAESKIPVKSVYEDDKIMAILDINPSNVGHVLLFPKEHATVLVEVPDDVVSKMFVVANKIAKNQFEKMDAKGTNIVVSNGQIAGQTAPHVLVNVIPRFEGDKVAIGWDRKKADESELDVIAKKIEVKATPVQAEPVLDDTPGLKEDIRIP